MASKAKDKPRKQRLKVFRTPIGFHDAYVAAPSRKAALAAWGADSNLFAQGIAEEVTEPGLMAGPLATPGEVVRRMREAAGEEGAAVAKRGKGKKDGSRIGSGMTKKSGKARPPRPSGAEVEEAKAALEEAEARQRSELRAIDREAEAIERRRRDLIRRHERERDGLAEALERARATYERAMRAWERG
ncbi:MAG TPA: hypothetical protein VFK58_03530 [Sphingomicrobium sp.]|nr:hypothetical protein [Sphingomicrobium sp.]